MASAEEAPSAVSLNPFSVTNLLASVTVSKVSVKKSSKLSITQKIEYVRDLYFRIYFSIFGALSSVEKMP